MRVVFTTHGTYVLLLIMRASEVEIVVALARSDQKHLYKLNLKTQAQIELTVKKMV